MYSRVRSEPAVAVGAVVAIVVSVAVALTGKRSLTIAAGIAGAAALVQGAVTRSFVSPVATVEDARNEGAAEMLDAVAESRLDPDLWEAIRAVPIRPTYDYYFDPNGLNPAHPHGKEK